MPLLVKSSYNFTNVIVQGYGATTERRLQVVKYDVISTTSPASVDISSEVKEVITRWKEIVIAAARKVKSKECMSCNAETIQVPVNGIIICESCNTTSMVLETQKYQIVGSRKNLLLS